MSRSECGQAHREQIEGVGPGRTNSSMAPECAAVPIPGKWCEQPALHDFATADHSNASFEACFWTSDAEESNTEWLLPANSSQSWPEAVHTDGFNFGGFPYLGGGETISSLPDVEGFEMRTSKEQRSLRHQKQEGTRLQQAGIGYVGPIPSSVRGVPVTTLMVRGLPRLLQEQLLEHWPRSEDCKYDLVYMPYNVRHRCTLDYAFLNFVSHEDALAFYNRWQGRAFRSQTSTSFKASNRQIDIRIADRQGFESNMSHWKKTLRMIHNTTFLPAVFIGEQRIAFWEYFKYVDSVSAGMSTDNSAGFKVYSF